MSTPATVPAAVAAAETKLWRVSSPTSVTLPRTANQARGLGEFAVQFMKGKIGTGIHQVCVCVCMRVCVGEGMGGGNGVRACY